MPRIRSSTRDSAHQPISDDDHDRDDGVAEHQPRPVMQPAAKIPLQVRRRRPAVCTRARKAATPSTLAVIAAKDQVPQPDQ